MDKILRRVRMAERQVARRNKERAFREYMQEKRNRRRTRAKLAAEVRLDIGYAIGRRHEDLEMGPITPNRDIMKVNRFGNYYGSISTSRALLDFPITEKEREARCAWAGGSKYLCLAPGDRVVITEGHLKGRITTIESIDRNLMTVELAADFTLVNATVPEYVREPGQSPVQLVKARFPISAIRLVHPVADPVTGVTRDVIIRELKPFGIVHDRVTRKVTWARFVPGQNIKIPWPKLEPKEKPEYAGDTLRIDMEERTFVPTLLRPPMPEQVIDELRNRYSKFRTRHTAEYIAEKEAEEAEKKARKKAADAMLLPIQEYNRRMRELRRARGQPVLTEGMLEKIGQIIAQNLARRQAAARPAPQPARVAGVTALTSSQEKRDESVEKLEKAVEQLSLGGDAATPSTPDQPTTSSS